MINALTKQVQEHGVDSSLTLEMLRDYGIHMSISDSVKDVLIIVDRIA